MKIDNFRDINFGFENVTATVIDSSEIKDFDISPYEYYINGDKVYFVTIRLNANITNFRNIPEGVPKSWPENLGENYYLNPTRRINKYDDIVDIIVHKKDGYIQKLVPYWGDFNVYENNLYQRSKYETRVVNGKIELTGDFIIEVYVKEMSDLLSKVLNTCNVYKRIINEMLVNNNPLCLKGEKERLVNSYNHDSQMFAQSFVDNKINSEEDSFNVLYEIMNNNWQDYSNEYKKQISDVSKEIYKKISNMKYCEEWEDFDYE